MYRIAVIDDDQQDSEKITGFDDRLSTMPEGIKTFLYWDFAENGVEISGGEAQKIAVFDSGRIISRGSHEELYAQTDGMYRKLWDAQAQYYV